MVKIDDAEAIRKLAYEIWEREGCPSGREHEHWAEANRVHASRMPPEPALELNAAPVWDRREAERQEIDSLRKALWTPEPFSAELFGNEALVARRTAGAWRRRKSAAALSSAAAAALSPTESAAPQLSRLGTGR